MHHSVINVFILVAHICSSSPSVYLFRAQTGTWTKVLGLNPSLPLWCAQPPTASRGRSSEFHAEELQPTYGPILQSKGSGSSTLLTLIRLPSGIPGLSQSHPAAKQHIYMDVFRWTAKAPGTPLRVSHQHKIFLMPPWVNDAITSKQLEMWRQNYSKSNL